MIHESNPHDRQKKKKFCKKKNCKGTFWLKVGLIGGGGSEDTVPVLVLVHSDFIFVCHINKSIWKKRLCTRTAAGARTGVP